MDARPVAVAAGVVLAALLFVWLQRDLARANAGRVAQALAVAAYLTMAIAWLAVFTVRAPTWVAWLATGLALAVTVAHGSIATISARRSPYRRLASEVGAIRVGLSTLTTSRYERARLRERARALDRWREHDTSDELVDELVELVQREVTARLDEDPIGHRVAEREHERAARIHDLVRRIEQR